MTFHLDTPIQIGDRVFAALSEQKVTMRKGGSVLMGLGHKCAVILLCLEDDLTGLGLDGVRYSRTEIERRLPGTMAKLTAFRTARARPSHR